MVTVGSILHGTFRFARHNIPAILVWSALLLLASLLMMGIMRPVYEAQLATLQTGTPGIPAFGAAIWLTIPAMIVIVLVLWAAVFRAVLFPAEPGLFYLRLGMDEVRLLGVALILGLATFLAEMIGVLGVMLVAGLFYAFVGKMVGVLIGALLGLAWVCAFIWVVVRISPMASLTILERKIIIGPAWRLSRGHFWRLFGAYIVIALAPVALYIVIALVQMGPILSDMFRPADPDAARRVVEWQVAHYRLGFLTVAYAVITSFIGGVSLALHVGMTAVATTQLIDLHEPDRSPVASLT